MSAPTSELHAPYPPTAAGLGGQPIKDLDDPITAVFIVLFLLGAITHMTILQVNLHRGRKFVISGMLFGFCVARIVACTMRLVWASYPQNISVVIAAQIFVALGVVLLFVINLIFTQRIWRASHHHLGWTRWFSLTFKFYYASIVLAIIMLVTGTVQGFYTLSPNTRRIDRDLTLFGSTYFAVTAFLPIPLLAIRAILRTRGPRDDFGEGRYHTKIIILLCSSAFLTLGAAFRAGIEYVPQPVANPAWYHSKAAFYLFDFTIDWTVVVFYAIVRVDKRFIVPNGCHATGDFSRTINRAEEGKDSGMFGASGENSVSTIPRSNSGNNLESALASEKLYSAPTSTAAHTQPALESPAPVMVTPPVTLQTEMAVVES